MRQYGLEGVRIQNVSELAGISAGAIYRHFEGKDQLLVECFTYVDKQAAAIFEHLKFNPLLMLTDPMAAVQDKRLLLDHVEKELCRAALVRLAEPRKELAALAASLDAMSPLKVLGRGFALVTDEKGKPLRRTEDAPVGSRIAARLSNGRLLCRVEESKNEEEP